MFNNYPPFYTFQILIFRVVVNQKILENLVPSPPLAQCPGVTPRRDRTFFAPLLTRREKNWGVSNAQGKEGLHFFFFCTVAGIGQGGRRVICETFSF